MSTFDLNLSDTEVERLADQWKVELLAFYNRVARDAADLQVLAMAGLPLSVEEEEFLLLRKLRGLIDYAAQRHHEHQRSDLDREATATIVRAFDGRLGELTYLLGHGGRA
jgi:hypothetical protein